MDYLSQQKISNFQEAICISIAICVWVFLYIGFQIPDGYLIPMSTGIIFLGIDKGGQGAIIKRSTDRMLGTFIGAFLGFLFVCLFMYGNYHWAYFILFFWCIGIYAFFITTNYMIVVVMITLFVPIFIVQYSVDPLNIDDVLIVCNICTLMGVIIAIIAEFVIYRNAATAKHAVKQNTKKYFQKHAEIIHLVSDSFFNATNETELNNNLRKYLFYFNEKTDDLSRCINNILDNNEDKSRSNPTCLYLRILFEFLIHADRLSYAVYNRNYKY